MTMCQGLIVQLLVRGPEAEGHRLETAMPVDARSTQDLVTRQSRDESVAT